MKNTLTLTIITAAVILFSACDNRSICIKGNGHEATQEFEVSDFENIELEGSFDVNITEGKRFEIKATGDDNILQDLKINRTGNTCKLEMRNGCYKNFDLEVDITMPVLEQVFLDGSGDITIDAFENIGDIYLEINGSGNIELQDIDNLDKMSAEINGSGNIEARKIVTGVNRLDLAVNGSGNLELFKLEATNVDLDINGSGDAEVSASSTLDVEIAGSGNVLYKGTPAVNTKITGSGSVINAN